MKDDSARDKAMEKLVERRLRADLKPGSASCLDAEILSAYVERTLAPRERANCEIHLASCARCQEHVAALVRLSEADEPVQVQTAAAAPARTARASWFRWAFAGPALAAVLVAGIYFTGQFPHTPEVSHQIERQNPVQAEEPPQTTEQDKLAKPAKPETGIHQSGKRQEGRRLDEAGRTATYAPKTADTQTKPSPVGGLAGNSAHRESAPESAAQATSNPSAAPPTPKSSAAQNQVTETNGPPAERVDNDRISDARSREIATPSVRSNLAKAGAGQGAGLSGGTDRGIAGGITSGTASNNASADRSKDDLPMVSRKALDLHPPAAPKTAKEKTDLKKSKLQNETKAKEDSVSSTSTTTELRDEERAKQSGTVGATTQSVEVSSAVMAPAWRVGRRGLIQESDSSGSWKKHKSGVKTDLNDISFASRDVGWAVGQAGTVLRTTDSGNAWTKLPGPTTDDLVHVTATSDQAATVVTRGGLTFTTTDGGKNWSDAQQ